MATVLNTARLGELIQRKYLTQTAFAKACGVSRQYISDVLKGKEVPTVERMIQFSQLLDVLVDDLLAKGEEPSKNGGCNYSPDSV